MAPLRCLTDCDLRLDCKGHQAGLRGEGFSPQEKLKQINSPPKLESKVPSRLHLALGLSWKLESSPRGAWGPLPGHRNLSPVHTDGNKSWGKPQTRLLMFLSWTFCFLPRLLALLRPGPNLASRACGNFFNPAEGSQASVAEVRGHNSPQQPKSRLSRG